MWFSLGLAPDTVNLLAKKCGTGGEKPRLGTHPIQELRTPESNGQRPDAEPEAQRADAVD